MGKNESNENNDINNMSAETPGEQEILEALEKQDRIIAKKVRRHRIVLRSLLVLAVLVALGIVIVWKVFTVEEVRVEGNKLHSAESIEKKVLESEHSWNSLYVYLSFLLTDREADFPYADSVKVTLANPHILKVTVNEKDVIAYFYDTATKQYVGFGEDSEVLFLKKEAPEGYTRVTGLEPEQIKLYQNMKLEDESVLSYIKRVLTLLGNYELQPDIIWIQSNNTMLLSFGDIQVNLGDNYYLNEKIVRMQQLMQKIEGQTGTLHLETWTEATTDVYFRMDELQTIPQ